MDHCLVSVILVETRDLSPWHFCNKLVFVEIFPTQIKFVKDFLTRKPTRVCYPLRKKGDERGEESAARSHPVYVTLGARIRAI